MSETPGPSTLEQAATWIEELQTRLTQAERERDEVGRDLYECEKTLKLEIEKRDEAQAALERVREGTTTPPGIPDSSLP